MGPNPQKPQKLVPAKISSLKVSSLVGKVYGSFLVIWVWVGHRHRTVHIIRNEDAFYLFLFLTFLVTILKFCLYSSSLGEIIKRNNTVDQALDCRDATAKVYFTLYYQSYRLFYLCSFGVSYFEICCSCIYGPAIIKCLHFKEAWLRSRGRSIFYQIDRLFG